LTRLLIEYGADPLLRADDGYSSIEALEIYDIEMSSDNRSTIVKVLDALLRHTDLDPFDFNDPIYGRETITLWNGVPFDILHYLFSQDIFYTTRQQSCSFIWENLIKYEDDDASCAAVDFLLEAYEKLTSSNATGSSWPYVQTLLQNLIRLWIRLWIMDDPGFRGSAKKISRALKLTNDLYRQYDGGTPLDLIASMDNSKIGPWLRLLSENEINLSEYRRYEHSQHLDGIINQGLGSCCRIITVEFKFGENEDDLVIEAHNICDPRFAHLDPNYRCEPGRSRENCISQTDAAFIGDDGKPLASLPGSWNSTMKPNSELLLVSTDRSLRLLYTDYLLPSDFLLPNPHTEAELEQTPEPHDTEGDSEQTSEPADAQNESDEEEVT